MSPRLFICHHHHPEDQIWVDHLLACLDTLALEGLYALWHDGEAVDPAMAGAEVGLLLLCDAFLDAAWERVADSLPGTVIAVRLRPCAWPDGLRPWPGDATALTSLPPEAAAQSLADLAVQVAELLPPGPAPAARGPFVGRAAELEALARVLLEGSRRAVALCGAEGMGKSRLLDHFHALHAARFPGGYQRLVLDPQRPAPADALLAELAGRFGIQGDDAAVLDALRARLTSPATLLHLENVDGPQALPVATTLLEWLAGCPVCVSGRMERRALVGHAVPLVLAELGEPDGLALLAAELPAPLPQEAAQPLLHTLGGLPLAIRLAAGALADGVRVDELLAMSADREQALTALLDAALRARLPDPALRAGFAALGHAPAAGFGRHLGAAVAAVAPATFVRLMSAARRLPLVESLGGEAGEPRWRLHPRLARHLREQAPGPAAAARVDDWFLTHLAEGGDDCAARWQRLEQEGDGLAAWLAAVPPEQVHRVERSGNEFAQTRGPASLWIRFLIAAQDTVAEQPAHRSDLLWTLSYLTWQAGDLQTAYATAMAKAAIDQARGEAREAALAHGRIADIFQSCGQFDDALRLRREEEIPVYERLGDTHSKAMAQARIADILLARGGYTEALALLREQVLPAFEQLADARESAATQGRIADILEAGGRFDEALRLRHEHELPVFQRLGDLLACAVIWGKIATIHQGQGRFDEALRVYREEELALHQRLGDPFLANIANTRAALCLLERRADGDLAQANRLLCQVLHATGSMDSREARQIIAILSCYDLRCPSAGGVGAHSG